ncbi:hypothetical protein [Mycobacterium talmoniae]|uniref:Uncharacterized protein n=1 Tax=Mycobacterium talmoniae TaxID=1858794 RepID=A0A1S1NGP4_9MYCO|nr:hypothetical protein [Mycobacterium talmoniae]OHV01744.1 hypothetical protein BKN37_16580 [Mycobacterium talmoniae]
MTASTELARLRAHADGFHALAVDLEALRRRRAAADTEVMRRLIVAQPGRRLHLAYLFGM